AESATPEETALEVLLVPPHLRPLRWSDTGSVDDRVDDVIHANAATRTERDERRLSRRPRLDDRDRGLVRDRRRSGGEKAVDHRRELVGVRTGSEEELTRVRTFSTRVCRRVLVEQFHDVSHGASLPAC